MSIEQTPKSKAIFLLQTLIELIEKDRIHVAELEGKTADEILAMAEAEAAEAVEGSEALKNSQ